MDAEENAIRCQALLTQYLEELAKEPSNVELVVNGLYTSTPGQWLPDTLTETLGNVYRVVGTSGDVFCETAAAWFRAGANHVLSLDEAFPKATYAP